ncbi:MAG TPA: sensor domain-containing diguanylate cyclase [Candidatus Acidoferrum sp.]|nr:sensor domain-containing diguanylate cyclase [Candidatus Acidoferrum sp.]
MTHHETVDPRDPATILTELASALATGDDVDATLGRLLKAATGAVGAQVGVVYLQDPDRAGLQVAVSIGLDEALRSAVEAAAELADDAPAQVARERVALTVASGPFVSAAGVAAADLRPLVVERTDIELPLGVLAVAWDKPHSTTTVESAALAALAAACAVAVDRGRLASLIAERSEWFERMAHSDPLTGLANHRTFARVLELELARAGRQGSEVSVAIFDVDQFASTNEASGHETGDDILRAVASVVAESVRLVDTVARYGGDEFVVVAPGAAGVTVARRVMDGIARLEPIDGRPITVSAGVAKFPSEGATSEELLASAEAALDRARSAGRGGLASAPTTAA